MRGNGETVRAVLFELDVTRIEFPKRLLQRREEPAEEDEAFRPHAEPGGGTEVAVHAAES